MSGLMRWIVLAVVGVSPVAAESELLNLSLIHI